MVVVSACMSGTRGSGVMSNTGDVLEMSVVRGVFFLYFIFIIIVSFSIV